MLNGKIELKRKIEAGSTFTLRLQIFKYIEIPDEKITKDRQGKKVSAITPTKNKKSSIIIVKNEKEIHNISTPYLKNYIKRIRPRTDSRQQQSQRMRIPISYTWI